MTKVEPRPTQQELDRLELLDHADLLKLARSLLQQGVTLSFHGKRTTQEIYKRVRPRQVRTIKELGVGPIEDQSRNLLVEGENLQAMVTLYKFRGEVNLILADPPYNTGKYFRYNDRWDEDPNDPDLGTLVTLEDGSRHTKWMKAMLPRLYMMKEMLRDSGVIAMCIDDNELYHLGMMMDEVFGEANRLAIINWQKTSAPKNDAGHVANATEYILVYAKDEERAKTRLLPRDDAMNAAFTNPDKDPNGPWDGKDPTAREHRAKAAYALQSPFTGILHYPGGEYLFDGNLPEKRSHWVGFTVKEAKGWLEQYGSAYELRDLGDERGPALVIKGAKVVLSNYNPQTDPAVMQAGIKAEQRRKQDNWPLLFFNDDKTKRPFHGRPRVKKHLENVKQGRVPWTFWADEEYVDPLALGSQSWPHGESGHSQGAKGELDALLGRGHGFETVKPLKLMKKMIQIWCPPGGLVMDPYAGSGTTGHAVLELNHETTSQRRFIMIEQGRPDTGDTYARTLTWERLKRAVTGERPDRSGSLSVTATALGGAFEYRRLTGRIDAKTITRMKRDDLIDVVITSHFEAGRRKTAGLIRLDDSKYQYLVGKNEQGEGYYVIWEGGESVGQLDEDTYDVVLKESKQAGLKPPHHVYARYQVYRSENVRFYQIPDRILMHLGFNEFNDAYNNESAEENDD